MNLMRICLLTAMSLALCLVTLQAVSAADKTLTEFNKAMSGSDVSKKKKAIASMVSGGDDFERIPALIKALNDRQAGKFALEALEKRTGLKPALRSGTNPGYPGYPTSRDHAGWSKWMQAKEKELADKEKIKELEEKAKQAEEKAQAAIDGESGEDAEGKDGEEGKEGDGQADTKIADKPAASDHEKYGKIDRVIFKNGNLLMCYIISKQVDLDGKLTSIDVVHKNGAGQESLDAKMISTFEEDVK